MVALKVVIYSLIYIVLLVVMGMSLVTMMSQDIQFTDDSKIRWDQVAFKRAAIKGAIFLVAFVAYFLMIYNFKFID